MSVIIPTYNRKAYVQEAIDSALVQSYPALEVIVVDDGSTDGTREALQARYGDRIKYLYQENQGESAARNRAIEASTGEYVALLDSDDVWRPTKLDRQVALLEERRAVGLVSCHVLTMDAQGQLLRTGPLHPEQADDTVSLESLALNSPVHASTVVVRRTSGHAVGWFDDGIVFGEDWDFCLRIACTCDIGFVTEPLAALRTHPNAQSRFVVSEVDAERRLADRLSVIDKAFRSPVSAKSPDGLVPLRRKTLALECIKGAMLRYLHGNVTGAVELIRLALANHPDAWANGQRLAQCVKTYALAIAKRDTPEAGTDFIRQVYQHLPPSVAHWRVHYQNHIISEVHVETAFRHYRDGQWWEVPSHALSGIRYDHRWLWNRGLLSITARSVVAGTFRPEAR